MDEIDLVVLKTMALFQGGSRDDLEIDIKGKVTSIPAKQCPCDI